MTTDRVRISARQTGWVLAKNRPEEKARRIEKSLEETALFHIFGGDKRYAPEFTKAVRKNERPHPAAPGKRRGQGFGKFTRPAQSRAPGRGGGKV